MISKPDKLVPMPKIHILDMRQILANIDHGNYDYDQTKWHCGTSHCVAGWKEWRDYTKAHAVGRVAREKLLKDSVYNHTISLRRWRYEQFPQGEFGPDQKTLVPTVYKYAARAWGMTKYEASDMFDGEADLALMRQITDLFMKGLRKVQHGPNFEHEEHPDYTFRDAWIDPNNPPVWFIEKVNNMDLMMEDLFL